MSGYKINDNNNKEYNMIKFNLKVVLFILVVLFVLVGVSV